MTLSCEDGHVGTVQIRCATPGDLSVCDSCKFDCRGGLLPRADERQEWFTPRKGMVTCGSHEKEVLQ